MVLIPFLLALLSFTSHATDDKVNNFCVADLKGPNSPSGYQCLPPNSLTVDNFVFSLPVSNTSNPIKTGISSAFVNDFPALNGLDISALSVIMDSGGYIPMHTHRGATELIIMVEGQMTAGFLTHDASYVKTLKPGDLMVIPRGLMHFVANYGKDKVVAFAAFSSSNPGIHSFNDIFSNNLPSDILAQTTFLDVAQVKKLKDRFHGSG
uniref:Germin-like protein n=2 Tax=Cajanus cajan TaxID=3821 RepID=A0A151QMN6_CAJCA|nr:Auxin-binding protein ABP19a [Cajanus cajan]